MLKKLFTVTVLGIAAATTVLAGGCASDSDKGAYGLTGTETRLTSEQQRYVDRNSLDQKGHPNSILAQRAREQIVSQNTGHQ